MPNRNFELGNCKESRSDLLIEVKSTNTELRWIWDDPTFEELISIGMKAGELGVERLINQAAYKLLYGQETLSEKEESAYIAMVGVWDFLRGKTNRTQHHLYREAQRVAQNLRKLPEPQQHDES